MLIHYSEAGSLNNKACFNDELIHLKSNIMLRCSKGKLKEKLKHKYKTKDKLEAKRTKVRTQRTHKDTDEDQQKVPTDLNTLRQMNK